MVPVHEPSSHIVAADAGARRTMWIMMTIMFFQFPFPAHRFIRWPNVLRIESLMLNMFSNSEHSFRGFAIHYSSLKLSASWTIPRPKNWEAKTQLVFINSLKSVVLQTINAKRILLLVSIFPHNGFIEMNERSKSRCMASINISAAIISIPGEILYYR